MGPEELPLPLINSTEQAVVPTIELILLKAFAEGAIAIVRAATFASSVSIIMALQMFISHPSPASTTTAMDTAAFSDYYLVCSIAAAVAVYLALALFFGFDCRAANRVCRFIEFAWHIMAFTFTEEIAIRVLDTAFSSDYNWAT